MTPLIAVLVLLSGAVVVLTMGFAGILRRIGDLESILLGSARQTIGPAIGTALPRDLSPLIGSESIAIFVDEQCRTCDEIVPVVRALALQSPDLSVKLLYRGSGSEVSDGLVVLSHMQSAFDELEIYVTPFALRIGADGLVADTAPVGSEDLVREFIVQGSGSSPARLQEVHRD